MTLTELKGKYHLNDGAKYEPNPQCKHCKGFGERPIKSRPHELTFCVCLFIEPSASDEIGDMLRQFAKDQLKKLEP